MKDAKRLTEIVALGPRGQWKEWHGTSPDNRGVYLDTDPVIVSLATRNDVKFCVAAADPEYGLKALAEELLKLHTEAEERDKPVKVTRSCDGALMCPCQAGKGTTLAGWETYCPKCGRKLEWS